MASPLLDARVSSLLGKHNRDHYGRLYDYIMFVARSASYEHFVRMDLFASNLRQRAAQLGISNAEAARRSGLSERRYAHYVSGVREPDLSTLVRIAQTLGTTPDVLLGVCDIPKRDDQQARLDRVVTAIGTLPDDVLDVIAIQIDALAAARGRSRT